MKMPNGMKVCFLWTPSFLCDEFVINQTTMEITSTEKGKNKRDQLAYFCCKSINWFLYVPVNVWNQFLSWKTTYFLTNFFVIFPHLNWPVDEIFFQKKSMSHEYLKIYGGNSSEGELTGENSPGGNWPGGVLQGEFSAPRKKRYHEIS